MEPIRFNFKPDVAAQYVDKLVEQVNADEKAEPQLRAVVEDVRTLVKFAISHLTPVKATAPAESGKNHKS